jgi:hypothetical protein
MIKVIHPVMDAMYKSFKLSLKSDVLSAQLDIVDSNELGTITNAICQGPNDSSLLYVRWETYRRVGSKLVR